MHQDFWINRRTLQQDLAFAIVDQKIRKTVMDIIEAQKTCDMSERDQGKEPILKDHESLIHEYYADGTGAWKKSQFTDWTCPTCGGYVGTLVSGTGRWHIQGNTSYCSCCGQRIDWTKPDEEQWKLYDERKEKERQERERSLRMMRN